MLADFWGPVLCAVVTIINEEGAFTCVAAADRGAVWPVAAAVCCSVAAVVCWLVGGLLAELLGIQLTVMGMGMLVVRCVLGVSMMFCTCNRAFAAVDGAAKF